MNRFAAAPRLSVLVLPLLLGAVLFAFGQALAFLSLPEWTRRSLAPWPTRSSRDSRPSATSSRRA